MSKSLVNAILSLRSNGKTKHEIRQLVESILEVTFITHSNVQHHLDQIVSEMPNWTIEDRESATIKNSNGQRIWFGPAVGGGMSVSQKGGKFVEGQWGPPGFTTKPPIAIDDLIERINKLKLSPAG